MKTRKRHPLALTVMAPTAAAISLLIAACSSAPQAPPPQYYQLRLDAPAVADRSTTPASAGIWQLMSPIRLPEYLERDVLWLPVGEAGLQPLPGHRWAEPLDEAVPRILLHDLAQLHGAGQVWSGSVPSGVTISRQLRVQVLDLSAAPDRRSVKLSARCSVSDPQHGVPLRILEIQLSVPSTGVEPDALVAAHRLALWQMAREIAAKME